MTNKVISDTTGFWHVYRWMLPGVVASYIAGGFVSGGWGLLTPLVFAGAARADGMHQQLSMFRLALQRAFSFFGILIGTGIVFVLVAGVSWLLTHWLLPESHLFGWIWLGVFCTLAWWPLMRLWMAPALPFVVDEDMGGQAPFSYFLWVGPGMFSAWSWSRVPGQWRRGAPVMLLLALTLALFLFSGVAEPESGQRLPLAIATVSTFALMPLTVYAWLRCGRRAYHAAICYQQHLDRRGRDPGRSLRRLSPAQLLEAGIDADDRYWIEIAVRAGADPDQANERGVRPLHRAAARGRVKAATALVARGADPDVLDADGFSSVAFAAAQDRPEVVATLAGLGADIEGAGGRRPLCAAADRDRPGMVECLLDLGAAVNPLEDVPESRGWPLLCAVRSGNPQIVAMMIEAGARLPDDPGLQRQLLEQAAESRKVDVLRRIMNLYDQASLAEMLPPIERHLEMLEADRPSGHGEIIGEIRKELQRLS